MKLDCTRNIIMPSLFICVMNFSYGQKVSGLFKKEANQKVVLYGYEGLKKIKLIEDKCDETGYFSIRYKSDKDRIAVIGNENSANFVVLLTGEDIQMMGEDFSSIDKIKITKGDNNLLFQRYAVDQTRRENAASAWNYLFDLYSNDKQNFNTNKTLDCIAGEMQRLKTEEINFLSQVPCPGLLNSYIKFKQLLKRSISYPLLDTNSLRALIESLRTINYADENLIVSGLMDNLLEIHFKMLENSGTTINSRYEQINISIDSVSKSLVKNQSLFNEVIEFLYDYFEKNSLFISASYLANKTLNHSIELLTKKLYDKLEEYRSMRIGNTAPAIDWSQFDNYTLGINDIQLNTGNESKFKLLFFGASWCPLCVEETKSLVNVYDNWVKKGLNATFISLDTNQTSFTNFASTLPFISLCNYSGWETQAALDYHIYATPTYYLLDQENRIILRPKTIKQIDAWVNWNLSR